MTTLTIGQSITQSAELLANAGNEINNLCTLLANELPESINESKRKLSKNIVVGDWVDTDYLEGWVYLEGGSYIPLYAHHNSREATKYLNIQIALGGENAKVPGQPTEPLIHIYMMDEAVDFSDMYLNPEECLEDESAELINNVLFSWDKTPESWQDQYWSFSVKLTSVNSLQDLREKIIAPAVELITSEYQDDVAVKLSDIEGIVRFK